MPAMKRRTSTPATSAPSATRRFAIGTTPRFQPPSPERKSTTCCGGPAGAYTCTVPSGGNANVSSPAAGDAGVDGERGAAGAAGGAGAGTEGGAAPAIDEST